MFRVVDWLDEYHFHSMLISKHELLLVESFVGMTFVIYLQYPHISKKYFLRYKIEFDKQPKKVF